MAKQNRAAELLDMQGDPPPAPEPMPEPEKPTKKPRTASPVQLASRAFQRMCDLQAQRAREATRHAEHVAKTDRDIAALEAELDGMPEVRRLFEGLRAAAEGAS